MCHEALNQTSAVVVTNAADIPTFGSERSAGTDSLDTHGVAMARRRESRTPTQT
jgi:hypothetical protein